MGKRYVTGNAYFDDRLDTVSGDKATVDAFFYGTTHSDGAKMIEIKMLDITSWTRITERRYCVIGES
jgi:hypothetical protein